MCIKLNNFGILKKERNISKGYAHHFSPSCLIFKSSQNRARTNSQFQTILDTESSFVRSLPLSLSRNCKLQKCNPDDPRASVDACAGRTLVTARTAVSLTHMCVHVNGDATDRCIGEGKWRQWGGLENEEVGGNANKDNDATNRCVDAIPTR